MILINTIIFIFIKTISERNLSNTKINGIIPSSIENLTNLKNM